MLKINCIQDVGCFEKQLLEQVPGEWVQVIATNKEHLASLPGKDLANAIEGIFLCLESWGKTKTKTAPFPFRVCWLLLKLGGETQHMLQLQNVLPRGEDWWHVGQRSPSVPNRSWQQESRGHK